MSLLSELQADPHIRRHVGYFVALVIALAIIFALVIGAQWFLRESQPPAGDLPIVSSSTPAELTAEQKMAVLNSLQASEAAGTGAAASSSPGDMSSSADAGSADTIVPADDPRVQILDSLSSSSSGSGSGSDASVSDDEKASILDSLQ